jgi:hypothetical protein
MSRTTSNESDSNNNAGASQQQASSGAARPMVSSAPKAQARPTGLGRVTGRGFNQTLALRRPGQQSGLAAPAVRDSRYTRGGDGLYTNIADPNTALKEQLQDQHYMDMRADMGGQYVENLALPSVKDLWIPGYRIITEQLAREVGLTAAYEDDPFSDMPLDEPQPPSAAVVGNTIAAFVDGVTGQQKNDVLNDCLLAELAANVKFNKDEMPIEWTRFYTNVLENIGWVIPDFRFSRLSSSQSSFTMDQVILHVLESILSGNEASVAKAAIDAVKDLSDNDRRVVIFEQSTASGKTGQFLVEPVGVSPTGVVSMKLGAFDYKTSEQVTRVLWFQFRGGPNTSLQVTKSTFVLNEQVHERLRDAILNKLGTRGLRFIAGVDIGDELG